MASYQRVALFILFDSIEQDLIDHIRAFANLRPKLTEEEAAKAQRRLSRKENSAYDTSSEFDLLYGLDIAEKYAVLMRSKDEMDQASREYFKSIAPNFLRSVSVRNDIMHGRPLTVDEHVFALSFAQSLLKQRSYWPSLDKTYLEYTDNPTSFLQRAVEFLDEPTQSEVLNNLPVPDYDDTGFLPRPDLERELKKKILGRHPVVTVLGEGGNGKTALALQVLYGLVRSSDHKFDAILWVTAKTAELSVAGIREIGNVAVSAIEVIDAAAALEVSEGTPKERLIKLLTDNKILLVIDNYETIVGGEIANLAQDVPGESKILFTSRLPIGSDLTVLVNELSPEDAKVYFRRLVEAYAVRSLKGFREEDIERHLLRLSFKPLLIKWFVLGVHSGLSPDSISSRPDTALRFCLDNVIANLGDAAQAVLVVLATLPSAAAASVIQHVSKLRPSQVTDGIAELSKYGLVESEVTGDGAQLFRIKPFSRSYIHRLIDPKPEITARIIENNQRLEMEFQQARGQGKAYAYYQRNYRVASRSEMLISNKLRDATAFAASGEFELAEQLLLEAKALEPTYFESHRAEAFIAQQQNDWSRAITAYEVALELAPEEPQLHFFFAVTLMRLIENDRAAQHFKRAMELDSPRSVVLREAVRNEFMRYDFVRASELLEQAFDLGWESESERIKLVDLKTQLFTRNIEFCVRGDSFSNALELARGLQSYLGGLDRNTFDARMLMHIAKVMPSLYHYRRDVGPHPVIDDLIEFIDSLLPQNAQKSAELVPGGHTGLLKQEGRRVDYGFLGCETCDDVFVHIRSVSRDTWEWMLSGGEVRFDIREWPKRCAINVTKAD